MAVSVSHRRWCAALSCVLIGSTTVTAWHFAKLAGWTAWHEVYVGSGVALLAYVLVSLMAAEPGRAKNLA